MVAFVSLFLVILAVLLAIPIAVLCLEIVASVMRPQVPTHFGPRPSSTPRRIGASA